MSSSTNDKKDKNIHDGHRKRLHTSLYERGYEALSLYEQVEALLTYIIPRGDVNPLAHALVDRFCTFADVIDGSIDELREIKGLNEMSSTKIKNMLELMKCYADSKAKGRVKLITREDIYDLLEELYRFSENEETYVFSMSKNYTCNGMRKIGIGSDRSVGVELKKIYRFIDSYRSSAIFIVHNHPEGISTASQTDVDAYEKIKNAVENYGSTLLDSFVVADDGIYSMKLKEKVRTWRLISSDIEEFVEIYRNNKY